MFEGLVLGFLSWLSLLLSWYHSPNFFKRWTLKHPFITDALATGTAWFFITAISKSLIAVIGSIFTGLLVNFSIMGYKAINGGQQINTKTSR